PAEILGGQIAKRRARRLVVLVLEPGETLHATEHGADLWRALLPRRRPPLLVRVLGTDLEEEAYAVARDRDLEVSVLLVPATVRREGHPCVVRRIDGPPCMLGDVDERLVAGGALDGRSQAMADRLELGPDALADLAHPRLEARHVEHLEIGGAEGSCGHRVLHSTQRRSGGAFRKAPGSEGDSLSTTIAPFQP